MQVVVRQQLYTVDEAAALLGCSRRTVYTLIRSGWLEFIKLGHLRRIPFVAVDDLLDTLRDQAAAS